MYVTRDGSALHRKRLNSHGAVFDVGMLKAVGVKQGCVIAFYQLWFAAAFLLSCVPLIGPIIGDLLLALFFYTSYPPPPPFIRSFFPSAAPLSPVAQQTNQPRVRPLPLREEDRRPCRRKRWQQGASPPPPRRALQPHA